MFIFKATFYSISAGSCHAFGKLHFAKLAGHFFASKGEIKNDQNKYHKFEGGREVKQNNLTV